MTFVLLALMVNGGCRKGADIPEPGSKHYADLVSAFYVGLAGLQAGEDVRAKQGLTLASQIAPGEPATWADISLLELRQQQYDQALQHAQTARDLAPENSQIHALLGLIESKRGNLAEAIHQLQEAAKLDPANTKALYALAQETERQGSSLGDAEARRVLNAILQAQPNNQAVLLDLARLSAKIGDQRQVSEALVKLQQLSVSWPDPARKQLEIVRTAAISNVRSAAVQVQFLRNLLVRDAGFRRDLDALRPPAGTVGEPFIRFIKLATPSSLPAPSDTKIEFTRTNTAELFSGKQVTWAGSFVPDAKSEPRVIWADQYGLHLDQGTTLSLPGHSATSLNRSSVASGDLNYDFRTDIVIANEGGVRIYQQGTSPLFSDVTAKTKLNSQIINARYTGAWLFDVDLDGDLDIVLGTLSGLPVVLRNNGDSSYTVIHPFSATDGVKDFAAADLDADGDPDVAILDRNGQLKVFANERLGNYRSWPSQPAPEMTLSALTTADLNGDGMMDLVALTTDNRAVRISGQQLGSGWEVSELVRPQSALPVNTSLLVADIDNNGSLDLVIGNQVFLHDSKGFSHLPQALDGNCQALLDVDAKGRLDAVALNTSGSLTRFANHGTRNYKWQILRTRASQTNGDQRINAFGLGGEVELRSGLLTQKQSITSPVLHFGLGENPGVSLARIVWPNGQLQVEFDLKPDATALAQQRLKGSCPFLFAWDGKRMRFVKDCAPWSAALGLHVNAQKVAGVGQTQEWFRIPGDQVSPRDGFYDLRITAEYWETFYIDHYSFLAVDHPHGTEIFTDERFAVPSPPLRLYETAMSQPFERAHDDNGNDVSEVVKSLDARYLDNFGRGRYQGVTRKHWVELELQEEAPRNAPVYLVGSGWVHPTDATVNVALGQSSAAPPEGLSIEVIDQHGQWHLRQSGLGFPSGRMKTVVLDLSNVFLPGAPRRLRLCTNLEIYWDRLAWAAGTTLSDYRIHRLALADAKLNYRGFSKMSQANLSSPELPAYDAVEQRGPRWRDLEGYYTRYGDVRPLLEEIDDRILITNAGDELRLKLAAPSPPEQGWTRDLVMIGDGWIKDGDFNCVFSKTVLPLPYHGLKDYTTATRGLEEDPAFQLHPEDWKTFHTRYISPELFRKALWQ